MQTTHVSGRPFDRVRGFWFCLAAVAGMLVVGRLGYYGWSLNASGLSVMSDKPPTWDFTNLWMGGRLALTQPLEAVFSPETFREAMRAMFGQTVDQAEWSYPPTILLVGAPLAFMPLMVAYGLFSIGGLIALMLVCRMAGLSKSMCLLVAVSPPVLFNGVFGQNGSWTTAFLIGGLILSDRRPMLAGLLIGLLTMKPHLGLLVPLCLVAAGHWRAFGWACVFSLAIAGLTTAVFGAESWILFLTETRPLMQAILEIPWGSEDYQMNVVTVFHLARALGAGVEAAYAVQAVATGCAAVAAWRLWRAPGADPLLRAATTALLTLIASPYGWNYDTIPLAVALVALAAKDREANPLPLSLAYFYPAVNNRVTVYILPVAPLVIAFVAYACWRAAIRGAPAVTHESRVFAAAPRPGLVA